MNQLYKKLFTALLCCATIGSSALGMNGQETVNQTYARLLKARDITGLEAFKKTRPSWANAIDENIAHIRKEQTEAEMQKIRDVYAQLIRNEDIDGIQRFKDQYATHSIMTQDVIAIIQHDIAQIHKIRAERAKQVDEKIKEAITKICKLSNSKAQLQALLELKKLAPDNETVIKALQETESAIKQENNDQADSDSDNDDGPEAAEEQKEAEEIKQHNEQPAQQNQAAIAAADLEVAKINTHADRKSDREKRRNKIHEETSAIVLTDQQRDSIMAIKDSIDRENTSEQAFQKHIHTVQKRDSIDPVIQQFKIAYCDLLDKQYEILKEVSPERVKALLEDFKSMHETLIAEYTGIIPPSMYNDLHNQYQANSRKQQADQAAATVGLNSIPATNPVPRVIAPAVNQASATVAHPAPSPSWFARNKKWFVPAITVGAVITAGLTYYFFTKAKNK